MTKPSAEILQALRVRIAELCRWSEMTKVNYEFSARNGKLVGMRPEDEGFEIVPEYDTDLNAANDATRELIYGNGSTQHDFCAHLYEIQTGEGRDDLSQDYLEQFNAINAEAWQRCVALDRCLSETPIV